MSDFDEKVIERLKRLEREVERLQVKERPVVITDHGNLSGLGDDDHPQYLLTTGKAADSDKLDGNDSTAFATSTHNHDTAYLGITAKAADSDKLDGIDSTGFATATHSHDHGTLTGLTDDDHPQYLLTTGKAADADKLDGKDSTDFSLATHNHNAAYLGITATAADSSKLGNVAAASYLQIPSASTSSPTPTASSGTFTTVSCGARTTTFGKIRVYSGLVYIEDNGTAAGTLRVPIPSGTPQSLSGGKWAGFGHNHGYNKACDVSLSPSNSYLEILLYDGTTAIASGATISFTIVYEIQ